MKPSIVSNICPRRGNREQHREKKFNNKHIYDSITHYTRERAHRIATTEPMK